MEIFNGERMRSLRAAHLRGDFDAFDFCSNCDQLLDIEESLENLDAIRRMADTGYWLKTDVDDVGGIYKSLIKTLDRQLTDLYLDIHNAQAQAA